MSVSLEGDHQWAEAVKGAEGVEGAEEAEGRAEALRISMGMRACLRTGMNTWDLAVEGEPVVDAWEAEAMQVISKPPA